MSTPDALSFGPAGGLRFSRNSGRSLTSEALGAIRYPSPFFDIAHTYLPSSFKTMLRWCRYYFLTNPLINAVCYKMAEYPVTDLVFDTTNEELRRKWEYIFNRILNFKKFEVEAGLDYNCFHGDVKAVTKDGVFKLRDLAGKTVDVLSQDGIYRPATFKSFGKQRLLEVEFSDGSTVLATPDHEWPVLTQYGKTVRMTTTDLPCGGRNYSLFRNVAARPEKTTDFYEGVRHGFVFGDGTLSGNQAIAYFCGAKDKELLKYFEGVGNEPREDKRGVWRVSGLPSSWKTLPDTSAPSSYWYGFVCGFLAADGSVDVNGCVVLTQSSRTTLEIIKDQLPRIGMAAGKVRGYEQHSEFPGGYEYDRKMFYLSLLKQYMGPDDLLLTPHRRKFEENFKPTRYSTHAHVVDVRETGIVDEVFCCVEPETHTFTLANGVLTANCYGNAFISISFPFQKLLICKHCGFTTRADDQKYLFREYKFVGDCKRCGNNGEFRVRDHYLRSIRDIRLIRWNPEYITVQHNDATAEERFYYSIPPQMANDIRMAKRHIVERVPQVFIEALRQNKALLFSRDNIYHMKRPTIAQKDKGWGMPMILPVLKDVFYLQVLRKAQEAIAVEHIVPLRLLFPQTSSSSADVYCVSLNTLIETREGPRPAQDVRVGDYLKSHMGAWDRVEAIKDRSVPKSEKVYRFKVASLPAFPFELSEEHPIWAARKWSKEKGYDGLSEPDWVNSKDLKKGDFVLYPTIRKTWTSLTLDLAEYIPERAATEHYIYRRLNQASAEIYEYLEERGAVQHQRGEREQLLQERGWLLDDYHNAYSAFSLQEKIDRISRYLPVTEDLAYLVGLYAAEGYLNGGSPCFALHSREVDIRQDIDRIVETLGFRAGCAGTYDVTEEGVTHNVHDVLLGAFLRTACGDKSERKRLPRFVLEAPKNIAMAAARGLLAGDGCNFKTETRRIGLMSVSKDLVVGLRSILLSEGFIPTAQVRIPNEGEIAKLPVYQLNLNGSQADELARRFGWDRLGWVPGKQEHWSQCGFIRDGYVYLRINEIEEAPEVETVRGFQMEGDRSFCVVGVATHNSTINLTQWRDKIEQELIRWRLDNNYIPLLPIPVGQQTLGGEGKALMLAQEYRVWSEQVIAGLGVPIEFVYGGMQFCQKIDSYVFTSKGLLQLKDLIPAGEGQTETGAGVLVATKSGTQPTTACHNTGMKKAARVQTKLGLDSEPSYDHQFLTLGSDLSLEWKKTSDLTPGDHIAVRAGMNLWPTEIPLIQEEVFDQISVWRKSAGGSSAATQYPVPMLPTAVTPGIAKLLGYLISEGTCGETGLVFAQKCQEVMDDFLNTVESTFGYRPSKWKGTEGCTAAEIGRRPAVLLLRGLGAVGVSETKVVPDCIKRAPKHLVVEFLKAYFEGDGSVSTSNTGKQMVSCGSKSEELLKQIQLLLLNIGIVSSRYFYAKTDMWQLQIRSSYIDVFAEEIGFVSSIKQNQLTLRSAVGKTHVGERIPHLKETLDQVRQKYFCGKQSWSFEPVNCQLDKEEYTTHEVADILERDFTTVHYHIKKERLKVSRTLPGVGGRFGTALISRRDLQDFLSKYGRGVHKVIPGRSGDGMTYSRLSSADLTFLREKEPELAKRIEVLAESHYVWDEVQEVELFDFEVPMGDLTVDIDHSYVADGLVTHNSGSNVSMRILENHFLDQKAQRKQLVTDFLMPNIGAFMGWEVIPCHYKKFKMADDLQRSAFNLQLNQAGKLSDRTLLEDVDRDHRAEMNQIKEEQKMILENQRSQALAQASIQGEAQLVGIKYQGRAQKIMMEQQGPMPSPQDQKALSEAGMQASGQPGMASPEATGQAMNTQVGMMNQTGQIPPMQLPQQGDQGQGQQQQDPMAGIQSPLNAGQNGAQPDLVAVAQQVASHLNQLPDHEKQMEMGNMQKTNPQLYSLVLSMVLTTAGADKPSNAAPLPEQRPPQRGPEAAMV